MDLDSWKPSDVARRIATLIASMVAVTVFLGLWLGEITHPLLALPGAVLLGWLLFMLLQPLIRSVLSR